MKKVKRKFNDNEFLLLYDKGLSDRAIANVLKVNHSSIWQRRLKFSLPVNNNNYTKKDIKAVKEKLTEYYRLRCLRNREKKRVYDRLYYTNNKHDKYFLLNRKFKTFITYTIRYPIKNSKNWVILGFGLDDFKRHIEAQFKKGMTWGNYASYWEIDHINPINNFYYESVDDDDFKTCWSLNNLRPLEVSENRHRNKLNQ